MIMSILFPDRGELVGARSRLGPRGQGPHRLPARGARRLQEDEGRRLPRLHRPAQGRARGPTCGARSREWLERVGLADVENKKCEELSKGMQQKLQFIAAVIHEPDLLILDEPFSGLDPVNMRLLRDLVLEQHRRGATIIFSTHVMHQAEQICDHVVMINDGDKVLDETLAGDPAPVRPAHDPLRAARPGRRRRAAADACPASSASSRATARYEISLRRRHRAGVGDGATLVAALPGGAGRAEPADARGRLHPDRHRRRRRPAPRTWPGCAPRCATRRRREVSA